MSSLSGVVIDLDGTLAHRPQDAAYADCVPIESTISRLRSLAGSGVPITIHTARGMRTYGGNADHIRALVLPTVEEWLRRHDVPFDQVVIAKPWPGFDGIYVDDRAVRPGEFASLSDTELLQIVQSTK